MTTLYREGYVATDPREQLADDIGQWRQADSTAGTEQILKALRAVLFFEAYMNEEIDRLEHGVRERLNRNSSGEPQEQVSFRVSAQQVLVRIEPLANVAPRSPVIQFGMLAKGQDMEWYSYVKQGDHLILREYRIVH